MKFVIISHVRHLKNNNKYFGYAPYVREMNIWLKYADKIIVVAPLSEGDPTAIDLAYTHFNISFKKTLSFNLTGVGEVVLTILKLPLIFWKIFWAMKTADHIHLRCPGNMGLIGCFVQVLFPNKIKTAKYAGNWDSKSKQSWSYRLQKWILSNTFLTRNMQVLVYGDWGNQSKNIKSFFTATYSESEKISFDKADFKNGIKFVFVGSLVAGKKTLYAVKLIMALLKNGHNVTLDLYGEGVERDSLENYIQRNKLEKYVILKGNQNKETLKAAYQKSHFVILPSKSEGWPKAIAEGMFWGCVPIATKVSCVPYMLDSDKRGVLLEMDLNKDIEQIENLIINQNSFLKKSQLATEWSRNFTTDVFENEIAKLIIK
ncbi:glycosyltransferase [Flavobacterium sp. CFBP9031]|uniref:glycosyltransferase family 4 protein n=1 Tax=Flavobacterium sp. CFBP9031 TaxID=3096538 RepID=UPI002A6A6BF3|nr:glycosyltransferase [Flavobacterium sp. CFBP9031]MDY0987431.1 glycosyltransferase [Flavobacterium sp. CFBP9031]